MFFFLRNERTVGNELGPRLFLLSAVSPKNTRTIFCFRSRPLLFLLKMNRLRWMDEFLLYVSLLLEMATLWVIYDRVHWPESHPWQLVWILGGLFVGVCGLRCFYASDEQRIHLVCLSVIHVCVYVIRDIHVVTQYQGLLIAAVGKGYVLGRITQGIQKELEHSASLPVTIQKVHVPTLTPPPKAMV